MAIRIGTNGANTLNGTNSADLILALDGDDIINAGGGNDLIFAGAGNDRIFAGDGSDTVFAGIGNDVVFGGNGNDFLFGEAGNDVLDGGRGSDTVDGGSGNDTLTFIDSERGGLDRYIGGTGRDSLVLEFTSARWTDPAVKTQVLAYLDFLATGNQGNFNFTTMNLIVGSVEALVVKVDGVIIDPRAGGSNAPTGVADAYSTSENGILTVSPATERGTLVDNDNTGTGAFAVELVTGPARGTLALNANGTFSFDKGTAFDSLAAGQSATETFTYRIVNSAGTSAPITVTLNIAGANDAATITGTTSGFVIEDDAAATTSGAITVTDVDAGQSAVANPGTLQGTYGSLALAADGTWVYTLNNALPSVQALVEDIIVIDSFQVTSLDGTATQSIDINVQGTNDAATVSGNAGSVTEDDVFSDDGVDFPPQTSGQIIVTDVDTGENTVANPGTYDGVYGSLELAFDGTWDYILNNTGPEVQSLRADETANDVFTLFTFDGTPFDLTIAVQGENDTAVVGGRRFDTITIEFEDLSASGFVTVTDIDRGEAGVVARTYEGTYGDLTMNADGTWFYLLETTDLPFAGPRSGLFEKIPAFTLGGDIFNIDISIFEFGQPG